MLGGWGFRFVQIKGPNKGQNKENVNKNLLLMNHWPECIDVWHGTSLGQGDFVQLKSLGS